MIVSSKRGRLGERGGFLNASFGKSSRGRGTIRYGFSSYQGEKTREGIPYLDPIRTYEDEGEEPRCK